MTFYIKKKAKVVAATRTKPVTSAGAGAGAGAEWHVNRALAALPDTLLLATPEGRAEYGQLIDEVSAVLRGWSERWRVYVTSFLLSPLSLPFSPARRGGGGGEASACPVVAGWPTVCTLLSFIYIHTGLYYIYFGGIYIYIQRNVC